MNNDENKNNTNVNFNQESDTINNKYQSQTLGARSIKNNKYKIIMIVCITASLAICTMLTFKYFTSNNKVNNNENSVASTDNTSSNNENSVVPNDDTNNANENYVVKSIPISIAGQTYSSKMGLSLKLNSLEEITDNTSSPYLVTTVYDFSIDVLTVGTEDQKIYFYAYDSKDKRATCAAYKNSIVKGNIGRGATLSNELKTENYHLECLKFLKRDIENLQSEETFLEDVKKMKITIQDKDNNYDEIEISF